MRAIVMALMMGIALASPGGSVAATTAAAAPKAAPAATAAAAPTASWIEGKHYFAVKTPRPLGTRPGRIVVTEVFSYACPACNAFRPHFARLKALLPATVDVDYVAAAFRADEDWPMFQKAFYAARVLGVDARTHEAMYDAVFKTNELAVMNEDGRSVRSPPPSLEDAAKFYARTAGVPADKFLATARGFDVDRRCREADQFLKTYLVLSTPTIVVNGKYRVDVTSAGGFDKLVEVVQWLVAREHV